MYEHMIEQLKMLAGDLKWKAREAEEYSDEYEFEQAAGAAEHLASRLEKINE